MNGFEFAESVRSGGAWSTTPMVALSVSASEADFVKGRDAGFDDYVAKHDRDALVTTLAQTISMAAQNAEKAD